MAIGDLVRDLDLPGWTGVVVWDGTRAAPSLVSPHPRRPDTHVKYGVAHGNHRLGENMTNLSHRYVRLPAFRP